jgi:hypothetical protein
MRILNYSAEPRRLRLTRRWAVLIAVVLAAITVAVAWRSLAYPRGMLAARFDMARGRYQIQTYGKPVAWRAECARLLLNRYGVKLNEVAGCCVTEELISWVDGYNDATADRFSAQFRKDILDECLADAWAKHASANSGRVRTAEEYHQLLHRAKSPSRDR